MKGGGANENGKHGGESKAGANEERDPNSLRWRIGSVIGQGRFGTVHLAMDVDTGELMAVKEYNLQEQVGGLPTQSGGRKGNREKKKKKKGITSSRLQRMLTGGRSRSKGKSEAAGSTNVTPVGRRGSIRGLSIATPAEKAEGRLQALLKQLEREVEIMSSIDNTHVVRHLGSERTTGGIFRIFMEYVPGGSIQGLIKRFGALKEAVVRSYTRQILRGLQALHAMRIAHRDIKAANILVTDDGIIKLADFGGTFAVVERALFARAPHSLFSSPLFSCAPCARELTTPPLPPPNLPSVQASLHV